MPEVADQSAPVVDDPEVAEAATPAQSARVEVRVPDIGEATNVVVIEVAVSSGDEVGPDDLLVVVESDKASMEIPAGHQGTVESVDVEVGTEVEEGTLIATISSSQIPTAAAPAPARAEPDAATPAPPAAAAPKPRDPPADSERPAADKGESGRVYAGPAVRRLARELGVDLGRVSGSGNRGRIVKDDVKAFVKKAMSGGGAATAAGGTGIPTVPAVDFSKFGPIELEPLSQDSCRWCQESASQLAQSAACHTVRGSGCDGTRNLPRYSQRGGGQEGGQNHAAGLHHQGLLLCAAGVPDL